jgi:S-adenosylmethionine:tRNA ribosyltransferase-isomerase
VIAAGRPNRKCTEAKLLIIDAHRRVRQLPRHLLDTILVAGDLVIANDAATLPASLHGTHVRSGGPVEVRLAGWCSPSMRDATQFDAVVFGAGDHRTPTEHRPPPPPIACGDWLSLGPLSARVERLLGHRRLVRLRFDGRPDAIWAGLARHGRPIQYAHLFERLALWDVWTVMAATPVAFEPPSAGFALDWRGLSALSARGVRVLTITHAAGLSSTGDDDLDRLLPFDEPYAIPTITARAIADTRALGGRVIAIGTTVVRALEHAAVGDGTVKAGSGVATQRIGPESRLSVADAILSGVHEPGTSHYELLRAFTDDTTLNHAIEVMRNGDYRAHEFGDSVFLERGPRGLTHSELSREPIDECFLV